MVTQSLIRSLPIKITNYICHNIIHRLHILVFNLDLDR